MTWILLGFVVPLALLGLYVVIGVLCARNILLRMKAQWPTLPLDRGDIAMAAVFGGLFWPIGWTTSFIVLPSLRSYTREPRTFPDLDHWAQRELARKGVQR